MNYRMFSSDIPKHRAITFTSAEQVEETFLNMGIHQEMQQLGRGSFQADLTARSTELADLFADRYSKACRMKLESPPDMVGLLFFRSANAKLLASGANVANDKLFFQPKGVVANLVTPDLAGSEVIAIPDSRFNKLFETLCPNHTRPECMTVINGNTKARGLPGQGRTFQLAGGNHCLDRRFHRPMAAKRPQSPRVMQTNRQADRGVHPGTLHRCYPHGGYLSCDRGRREDPAALLQGVFRRQHQRIYLERTAAESSPRTCRLAPFRENR